MTARDLLIVVAVAALGVAVAGRRTQEDQGCDLLYPDQCGVSFVADACPLLCSGNTTGNTTNPAGQLSFEEQLGESAVIVTAPVVAMMIGSLIALFAQPGPWVKIVFSGGAAGVLIAAVGFELFPIMTEDEVSWWSAPLGVLIGAGVFIVLGLILPDLEDEDEEEDEDGAVHSPTGQKANPAYQESEQAAENTALLWKAPADGRVTPSGTEPSVNVKLAKHAGGLPWLRLAAVCLDGGVDGMLLGIASSVGEKEAMLIAVGMTIEMCFVGVTLSTTLQKYAQATALKVLIVVLTPLSMYIGLVVGAYALYEVDQTSDVFVGVIGFGVAALLYLAVIELIPEVFEIGEEAGLSDSKVASVTTAVIFLGFSLVLVLENSISESDVESNL